MKSYSAVQEECIKLVSGICELEINTLANLTSDQIKELDVSAPQKEKQDVDGDITQPYDLAVGKRIQMPSPPKLPCVSKSTCSSEPPNYVDILYVPAHPSDGKRKWYAVTKEAVEALKQEKASLASAIVDGSKKATLQNLNDLGLLSRFESKAHEHFLAKPDADRYRSLIWVAKVLQSGASKFHQHGPETFIKEVMDLEKLDLQDMINDEVVWDKFWDRFFISLSHQGHGYSPNAAHMIEAFDNLNNAQEAQKRLIRARRKVHVKLLEHCDDNIKALEKKAEQNASKRTTEADGTKFVFDRKHDYFTSEKQKSIYDNIMRVSRNRPEQDETLCMHDHSTVVNKINQFWEKDLKAVQTEHRMLVKTKQQARAGQAVAAPYLYSSRKNHVFLASLNKVNEFGFAVKEQCLTMEELEGTEAKHFGPPSLAENSPNWRRGSFFSSSATSIAFTKDSSIIASLYEDVGSGELSKSPQNGETTESEESQINNVIELPGKVDWAYYPTLALIQVINATFEKQFSDLKNILGTSTSVPNFLSQLLWVKKVALARIDVLKKKAEKRAIAGNIHHVFIDEPPASFQLLWKETKHKPKRAKLGTFKNDAGLNDLQAVECSLLSDGEVFWVRGPHWYLGDPLALDHVKLLTVDIKHPEATAGSGDTGKTLSEALMALKKVPGRESIKLLDLSKQVSSFDTAFWKDGFHYQGGSGPDGQSAYIANAQAQFMRFTSSSSANINTPLDTAKLESKYGVGGEIKANVTLLSAQIGFSVWLPFKEKNKNINATHAESRNKVTGYEISIPYYVSSYDKRGIETAKPAEKPYDAGSICIQLQGTVYGLAAATCQLSASIAIGPPDSGNGIGIRGQSIAVRDYNQHQKGSVANAQLLYASEEDVLKSGVAEGKVSIDAFAGVEAGGTFGADVYWRPPTISTHLGAAKTIKSPLLKLGGLSGELAVSAGYGFSAELRLTFQDGCIVFIAAAKLVAGPGCKGNVGIQLNPINADRFIACMLGVLRQNDFRFVAFFGDRDENGMNKDFQMLNERLTVAVAMGLALSDVLLLPPVVFDKYKRSALQEEYAPLIADSILRKEKVGTTQEWVSNLPPETLAKLLSCLSNDQDSYVWSDAEKANASNSAQVSAILQILDWLTKSYSQVPEARKSQFERTLMLMNTNIEDIRTPQEQWLNLFSNWQKLGYFIKNNSLSDREKLKNTSLFNQRILVLCANFELYIAERKYSLFGVDLITKKEAFLKYIGPNKSDEIISENSRSDKEIKKNNARIIQWNIRL
ncbi:hypothetical protein BCT30_23705 [Enterovibrio norvegicus]|uniref:hypothetical protein n=1 Tax=Enterovibrio norvegicus TaxID=188144 RepID=UPI000C855C1D|nr:hypothetical protein [Enterovibrio norvegicus]MCC4799776.1 hypothetical protein [Enterovibrio norvegicus]PMI25930.1 hypothetical protein BCU47_23550 [Enterovibrio norvegicus]PMI36890.1 hypothetical protein BCU46_12535 [Enterovibrio norvegicus]PMN44632.1 hypothetical protein BCT30_23705 [Enterovibrio norvegicus]